MNQESLTSLSNTVNKFTAIDNIVNAYEVTPENNPIEYRDHVYSDYYSTTTGMPHFKTSDQNVDLSSIIIDLSQIQNIKYCVIPLPNKKTWPASGVQICIKWKSDGSNTSNGLSSDVTIYNSKYYIINIENLINRYDYIYFAVNKDYNIYYYNNIEFFDDYVYNNFLANIFPYPFDKLATLLRPNYNTIFYNNKTNGILYLLVYSDGSSLDYYISTIYGYGANNKCALHIKSADNKEAFQYEKVIDRTNKPESDIEDIEITANNIIRVKARINWLILNNGNGQGLNLESAKISEECINRAKLSEDLIEAEELYDWRYPYTNDALLTRDLYQLNPNYAYYTKDTACIRRLRITTYLTNLDFYIAEIYALHRTNKTGRIKIMSRNRTDNTAAELFAINKIYDDYNNIPDEYVTETLSNKYGSVEIVVNWARMNKADGINISYLSGRIRNSCIEYVPEEEIVVLKKAEFIPIDDYYISNYQQRIYFNEICKFSNDVFFAVSASGATYPEVIRSERYVEFNINENKDFSININAIDFDNTVIASKQINIHCVVDKIPSNKKFIFLGDSLTDNGAIQGQFQELENDAIVTLYGTRTSSFNSKTVYDEGRSSWSSSTYNTASKNNVQNPFFNPDTEKFDFSYYMQNNISFQDVDVVNIFLGRNDGYNTTTLFDNIDSFVDSILSYNPNIIVTLFGAYNVAEDSSGTGRYLQTAQSFNNAAHIFNMAFYEKYKSSEKVKIIPYHLNLDNKYDYSQTSAPISIVDDRTIMTYTDNVHPDLRGYKKFGYAVDAYFRYLFNQN